MQPPGAAIRSDRISDLTWTILIVAAWEILVGLLFSYSGAMFPHAHILIGPAAQYVDRLHGYANFDAAYYVSIAWRDTDAQLTRASRSSRCIR